MTELPRCPFCGAKPQVYLEPPGALVRFLITSCGPDCICHDQIASESCWSRRAADPFRDAALEYCRLWTRDARNALDGAKVQDELARARGRLYDAYKEVANGQD